MSTNPRLSIGTHVWYNGASLPIVELDKRHVTLRMPTRHSSLGYIHIRIAKADAWPDMRY